MAIELVEVLVLECYSPLIPLIEISDQLCRYDGSNCPLASPPKQFAKWTRVVSAGHLPVVAHETREFIQVFVKHTLRPETKPGILFVHVRGADLQTVSKVWLFCISIHFNSIVIKVRTPEIRINHPLELLKPFTRHKIYRHRFTNLQKLI